MAEFSVSGLDELILSMQEVAELPTEVIDEMLNAQADVVVKAQKAKVMELGIYDADNTTTRHVVDSIKKGKVKTHKGVRVIYVTPTGTRLRGEKRTRNAEVLFVNEFGTRTQKARPAVKLANEASAPAQTQAGLMVYDGWLQSKNL